MYALTSPNDIVLYHTKFKAFADDKLKVAKIMISVFDCIENIMGKEKKMLVSSIFSVSNNVFKRLLPLGY